MKVSRALKLLVTHLCKLRQAKEALRLFESLARGGVCAPTVYTFYPVLSLLTRENSLEDARGVVDLMAELRIGLDLMAHNIFLTAYCFTGDFDAAAGVLRRTEKEGLAADARRSTRLFWARVERGRWRGTAEEDVCEEFRWEDSELLGCLASKSVNLKKGKEAMSILEEMKQRGVPMGYKLKEFYEMNVERENGARVDGADVEGRNGV
ncbi:unnamed protein product [Sphenostylis stenocarpa]|uniref:Pentatricopeptide repeat-containing protein n=1 Tax=Sphenostylis stenocarpa TaxID=92480 RepID=A0AA86SJM1_9FABA|nr:unnamed protein product [Sphenostylis stenocarpa]